STDGQSCSGQTPDIAWEEFQKKSRVRIKFWRGKRFLCKRDGAEVPWNDKKPFTTKELDDITKQAARVQLRVTAKEKPLTNQQLGIQNFVPAQANVDETSHCSISAQNDLGALLKRCKLIIWDEAPMANKLCFEALDHSLRDILRKNRYDTCPQPFGNMTMVFGSGFRQVLLVIPKGSRQDIVTASLKQPYLWDHCNVLNMRLTVGARPKDVTKIQEFAEWILKV
ncbi:ATP-dependent DNA helicase PIF1-like protein, partial [Tanacetum coccineum]